MCADIKCLNQNIGISHEKQVIIHYRYLQDSQTVSTLSEDDNNLTVTACGC